MHDTEHLFLVGKTIIVAVIAGSASLFGFLVAQTEALPTDGSLAVILATALISALASMIYLFREDKKRLHDLEIKKQDVELERLKQEGLKSTQAAQDRKTREEALMNLMLKANENLAQCNAERQQLSQQVITLSRQIDPSANLSDTAQGKFVNGGQ